MLLLSQDNCFTGSFWVDICAYDLDAWYEHAHEIAVDRQFALEDFSRQYDTCIMEQCTEDSDRYSMCKIHPDVISLLK
jgi:hypothetical protein